MKVGLFFGSFNPIHSGHLILAHTLLQESELDKVWFVVSPQNPFKEKSSLLHEFDRYELVDAAIKGNDRLAVTDIEFRMPKPSYTVDTVIRLIEQFPSYEFTLLMGEDNLASFHKWKNYEQLLDLVSVSFYKRSNSKKIKEEILNSDKVRSVNAAYLEISSTFIRDYIKEGKSIKYLVPDVVEKIINEKGYYL